MNPLKQVDSVIADHMIEELRTQLATAPGAYGYTEKDYGRPVLMYGELTERGRMCIIVIKMTNVLAREAAE